MSLRVIGAGLPRTGTTSLKAALEHLLDGRCYHMAEFNDRFDHDEALWMQAFDGDSEALSTLLDGWVAAVDWPASVLWAEISALYPEALVILSKRSSAEQWWASVDATVWANIRRLESTSAYWPITSKMLQQIGLEPDGGTSAAAKETYDKIVADVTGRVDPSRLLVWEPSDGWEPLCAALDLPVPARPFFHHNTTEEFRRQSDLDV